MEAALFVWVTTLYRNQTITYMLYIFKGPFQSHR